MSFDRVHIRFSKHGRITQMGDENYRWHLEGQIRNLRIVFFISSISSSSINSNYFFCLCLFVTASSTFYQSFELCNSILVQDQSCFWEPILVSTGTLFKELRSDKKVSLLGEVVAECLGILAQPRLWYNFLDAWREVIFATTRVISSVLWLIQNPPPREDVGFTIYFICGSFRWYHWLKSTIQIEQRLIP